jgi:hypothetical protein
MRHADKIAPVAAAFSALATLACCLPVGFAAAVLTGSIGAFVEPLRPWFLGASVVFVGAGILQVARQRACNRRTSAASMVLLAASAVIVAAVMFFPQVVAGVLADWMP